MARVLTLAIVVGSALEFRRFDAGEIVGMARTTTGMCGALEVRTEATRIWTKQGQYKALSTFAQTDAAWSRALNGADVWVGSHVPGVTVHADETQAAGLIHNGVIAARDYVTRARTTNLIDGGPDRVDELASTRHNDPQYR
jgi:hypothetical protein